MIADLPLARFDTDRAATLRSDEQWLKRVWAADNTRVLVLSEGNVPVTDDMSLIWVKPDAIDLDLNVVAECAVMLGVDAQHSYVALVGDRATVDAISWVSLRGIGAQLSARDVGLAIAAVAMNSWHSSHSYCPRCGNATVVTQAGWARRCEHDGSDHYPRTEPAMIAAVNDANDRILLGRRNEWPEGWFSTLAGFVEAGESVEACVVREVFEEAGIRVAPESLRYLGSQPWPFPASLMLGYRATATSTDIEREEAEMADVRWYSREEFDAACVSQALRLPNNSTIAFHLIQHWYGKPIPLEWTRK